MKPMKILYIFPHPDDETFGPGPAMHAQAVAGDEIYLLTLTRGEATKERFKLGYDKEKMGQVRSAEMQCVAEVLKLKGLRICDLPDGEFTGMDPAPIKSEIRKELERIQPDVVVTYPVHGVSGFPDHLVTHDLVKEVFVEMRSEGADYLKRLAFFTLCPRFNQQMKDHRFPLKGHAYGELGAVVKTGPADRKAFLDALDCYATYQDVIQASGVKDIVGSEICYEFFEETYQPPLSSLTERFQAKVPS